MCDSFSFSPSVSSSAVSPSPSPPSPSRHPRLSLGAKLSVISLLFPFYSILFPRCGVMCFSSIPSSSLARKLLSSLRRSILFPVRLHVVSLSAVEVITNSVNRVIYRRADGRTDERVGAGGRDRKVLNFEPTFSRPPSTPSFLSPLSLWSGFFLHSAISLSAPE